MNAGFGSWLLGMALGAGAPDGMLGMAGGIFIALAATTIVTALLYAISGFGFAVLLAPLLSLVSRTRHRQFSSSSSSRRCFDRCGSGSAAGESRRGWRYRH